MKHATGHPVAVRCPRFSSWLRVQPWPWFRVELGHFSSVHKLCIMRAMPTSHRGNDETGGRACAGLAVK